MDKKIRNNARKYPEIPQDIKDKIIHRWRFSKLNSVPEIATEFNRPISQINTVINQYLSSKCK